MNANSQETGLTARRTCSIRGQSGASKSSGFFFQFCCEGFSTKIWLLLVKKKNNPFKIHQNLVQESLVLETDAGEVASLKLIFQQLRSLPFPTFATFANCELSKDNWI